MAVSLSLDEQSQTLCVRFEGLLTDELLASSYERMRRWIAHHGPRSSISDFGPVTVSNVTAQGVTLLAANTPMVPDRYLRIVVAPQDNIFGMVRMFEMLGSETRNRIYIFRTLPDAYKLLELTDPEFKAIEW